MNKDWTGNSKTTFVNLGASNHTDKEREENDYYATDPKAMELLLKLEKFNNNILEPSCGEGHLSKVLEAAGYNVTSHDLIDRGYGESDKNFLTRIEKFNGDIITNPPYKYAKEFVYKSIDLIEDGNKVVMFLKLQFLEGQARKKLFKNYPPKTIYISSSRITCAQNGNFQNEKGKDIGSAIAYCWYIWEKGYKGDTILKWFN